MDHVTSVKQANARSPHPKAWCAAGSGLDVGSWAIILIGDGFGNGGTNSFLTDWGSVSSTSLGVCVCVAQHHMVSARQAFS